MSPNLQTTIRNEILVNGIKDYHENLTVGLSIFKDVKVLDDALKDQPMIDATLEKFNAINVHLIAALIAIKNSTDGMQKLTAIAKTGQSMDPQSEVQFERFSKDADAFRLNEVLFLNSLTKSMVAFCGISSHTSHFVLHSILNSISDLIYQLVKQSELEQIRINAMLAHMANGLSHDDWDDYDDWDDDDDKPDWM